MFWIIIILVAVGVAAYVFLHDGDQAKRDRIAPLTVDKFPPEPIDLTTAKQIYRTYMLSTGLYDKEDVSEGARMFSEEVKEEIRMLKEEISEQKSNVAETRSQLKKETDPDEIESMKDEIEDYESEVERASSELAQLNADKKHFLIDYINREIQAG